MGRQSAQAATAARVIKPQSFGCRPGRRIRKLESQFRNLRKKTLPVDLKRRFDHRLLNVQAQRQDANPRVMSLTIDQRQKISLPVFGIPFSLARLLLLEAERDLVKCHNPPKVIPRLYHDVPTAPVPRCHTLEVNSANEEYPDTAFPNDSSILTRHRHEPLIAPKWCRRESPRDAIDDVVDDLKAGGSLRGEDRICQRGLFG